MRALLLLVLLALPACHAPSPSTPEPEIVECFPRLCPPDTLWAAVRGASR